MKYIFYDTSQFSSFTNIKFIKNKLIKKDIVYENDNTYESNMNGYYTILNNKKQLYLIYRSSNSLDEKYKYQMNSDCYKWIHQTRILVNINGKFVPYLKDNKIDNVILKGKCASHNFIPFISKCKTKYYGIGGLYTNEYHDKCDKILKKTYMGKKTISSEYYHPCHCNGLYLFQSDDLVNWEYVQDTPVISGMHKGQTEGRNGWICTEFDGKISIFYSNILKKYIIYVRSNIKSGVRWVQMATSDDLINWSPFQLIKMKTFNEKQDNYYHLDVMEYPGASIFIGLSPYTNSNINPDKCCIKLLFSIDGINWIDKGSILDTPLSKYNKKHNTVHTTGLFNIENDNFSFYFNKNYAGHLDRNMPSYINKYIIGCDKIIGITNNNLIVGEFRVKLYLNNIILFNLKHLNNGYLTIYFNDKTYYKLTSSSNKKIEIHDDFKNKTVEIKIEIYNTILYCIETIS